MAVTKNYNKRFIFHKVCFHLNTLINNNIFLQKNYLNNDLTLILSNFIKADSRFILECILVNNCINLKYIIEKEIL